MNGLKMCVFSVGLMFGFLLLMVIFMWVVVLCMVMCMCFGVV